MTHHGPVVSDLLEESGEFLEEGHVLAFSWTALDDDDLSGQALVNATGAARTGRRSWPRSATSRCRSRPSSSRTRRATSATWRRGGCRSAPPARATCRRRAGPANTTGVDRVPVDALPGAQQPGGSGRIVSANNRMVGHDYPYYLTDDWTAPYRAKRIEALLDARPKHDVASFAAIQQDLVSLAAARLTPVLLDLAAPANETMRTALAMLAAWDHGMGRDSAEALIYMAWVRELMHVLFADELGDAFEDYWKIRTEPIHRALGERQQWCDDVTTAGGARDLRGGGEPGAQDRARIPRRDLRARHGGLALGRGPRGPHEEPHPRRGAGHRLLVRDRHAVRRREGDDQGRRLRRGGRGAPLRPEPRRGVSGGLRLRAIRRARSSSRARGSRAIRSPATTRTTPSPGATGSTCPCSPTGQRWRRTRSARWCWSLSEGGVGYPRSCPWSHTLAPWTARTL